MIHKPAGISVSSNSFKTIANALAPFIRTITGIRRCGKSTLQEYIRHNNKEKKYALNFDDNRLTGFTSDDFEKLFEAFPELYSVEKTWYFDEIQNINGWEMFIRRLHNEGHKVYLTGSNAQMLSKELGPHLTVRYLQTELFPFSFAEFLKFKNIKLDKHSFYSTTVCTSLRNAFNEYLQNGGIPEYLQTQNPYYLKSLYENIIYRDVITRYNLRNTKLLIEFIHFLISNTSKETSYNSLKNIFGIANANTVKEYISYFENSYLLFSINKFDYSLKKQIANPKKIYAIDTGLANSVSFRFSENYGRQIENVVFLHLRRKTANIFYHKNKTECDFVVVENKKIISAIQVTQSLDDPSVREREIKGLLDAMATYKLKEGLIITEDGEDIEKINGQIIKIIPVWKWLLIYSLRA